MKAKNYTWVILANVGLLGASFLFVELALQLASIFIGGNLSDTNTSIDTLVEDKRLGLRGNPNWVEHDARGYRNPSAPNTATVVTLGDSQTYGTAVKSDETWPSLLSVALGKDIYNMGLPTYGASQNLENFSTAIALKPKLIIFGLYFGNDFYNDFKFIQRNGKLQDYVDKNNLIKISALEKQKTIEEEIGYLFFAPNRGTGSENSNLLGRIKKWASDNSKLYGLARGLKTQLTQNFYVAKAILSKRQLSYSSVYDGPAWKTILTSPYRLRILDDADPRIRAGIEISKQMLRQMHLRATKNSAKYIVLLIHTKEYIFWPRVKKPNEQKLLGELVRQENKVRDEIIRYMQKYGIDFIDPAKELRESERQPYFSDTNGHKNSLGHKIISEKVLKVIKKKKIFRDGWAS